ncbi:hypothetical protein DPMN_036846 [Dreissena polymorpha]|uniref:Uncharacterized protein n=1 Tax=Dreissena polymorpha TaxID=45954 RepID=A0A9D4MBH7_DREPO|nr:hypothetical protein DPMN_036846 [Dreissena polymorpha]
MVWLCQGLGIRSEILVSGENQVYQPSLGSCCQTKKYYLYPDRVLKLTSAFKHWASL